MDGAEEGEKRDAGLRHGQRGRKFLIKERLEVPNQSSWRFLIKELLSSVPGALCDAPPEPYMPLHLSLAGHST